MKGQAEIWAAEFLDAITCIADLIRWIKRSHVYPNFFDKSKAIVSRTKNADIFPTKRILPVRRLDRILLFMVHDKFVVVIFSYFLHGAYFSPLRSNTVASLERTVLRHCESTPLSRVTGEGAVRNESSLEGLKCQRL